MKWKTSKMKRKLMVYSREALGYGRAVSYCLSVNNHTFGHDGLRPGTGESLRSCEDKYGSDAEANHIQTPLCSSALSSTF